MKSTLYLTPKRQWNRDIEALLYESFRCIKHINFLLSRYCQYCPTRNGPPKLSYRMPATSSQRSDERLDEEKNNFVPIKEPSRRFARPNKPPLLHIKTCPKRNRPQHNRRNTKSSQY